MASAASCIGIAEPSMTSTSKIAASAFSFRFIENPFKDEFGSLASFSRGYRMASDNTSLRSRGGSKRMGSSTNAIVICLAELRVCIERHRLLTAQLFFSIYRDSVFADHACFCLVGVHVFSHLTFRPFGCWMLV